MNQFYSFKTQLRRHCWRRLYVLFFPQCRGQTAFIHCGSATWTIVEDRKTLDLKDCIHLFQFTMNHSLWIYCDEMVENSAQGREWSNMFDFYMIVWYHNIALLHGEPLDVYRLPKYDFARRCTVNTTYLTIVQYVRYLNKRRFTFFDIKYFSTPSANGSGQYGLISGWRR